MITQILKEVNTKKEKTPKKIEIFSFLYQVYMRIKIIIA